MARVFGMCWRIAKVDVRADLKSERLADLLHHGWEPYAVTQSTYPNVVCHYLRRLGPEDVSENWQRFLVVDPTA